MRSPHSNEDPEQLKIKIKIIKTKQGKGEKKMRLSGPGRKRCLLGRKEKWVVGQEETRGRILGASLPSLPGPPPWLLPCDS